MAVKFFTKINKVNAVKSRHGVLHMRRNYKKIIIFGYLKCTDIKKI